MDPLAGRKVMIREEKSVVVHPKSAVRHASSAGLFAQAAQHASTMNRKAGKKKSNTPLRPALNVETEDFIAKLEEKSAMIEEKSAVLEEKSAMLLAECAEGKAQKHRVHASRLLASGLRSPVSSLPTGQMVNEVVFHSAQLVAMEVVL